jgi:uncharacterized protein (TIGR03083 family)
MATLRKMDRERVFASAADERRRVADLLDQLDEAEVATASLCAGWDIKTVAAHVVSTLTDGTAAFVRLAVRRGSLARAIDELASRGAERPVSEIVAVLHRCADRRISPPVMGPLDPLADILVHSGDIRIPLGLPFEPDPERANAALDFLTGPWPFGFVPRRRLRGLCLRATDSDRTWGDGAEVRGPAAALMIAACGRTALLDPLEGPGAVTLRRRLRQGR